MSSRQVLINGTCPIASLRGPIETLHTLIPSVITGALRTLPA